MRYNDLLRRIEYLERKVENLEWQVGQPYHKDTSIRTVLDMLMDKFQVCFSVEPTRIYIGSTKNRRVGENEL